jgi:hypothetical protein
MKWLLNDFKEKDMCRDDLKDKTGMLPVESVKGSSCFPRPLEIEIDPFSRKANLGMWDSFFKDDVRLVPGAIVAVSLAFVLEHTGIYIGEGEFIELYGDGSINKVNKKEFIEGAYRNNDFPLRTGMNVYVATLSGEPIVVRQAKERAMKLYDEVKQIPYSVLANNCHMFTGFCVFGKDFQQNYGCRFFTNLTTNLILEFGSVGTPEYEEWKRRRSVFGNFFQKDDSDFLSSVEKFCWRISDRHYI